MDKITDKDLREELRGKVDPTIVRIWRRQAPFSTEAAELYEWATGKGDSE